MTEVKLADASNFTPASMDDFVRYQEVTKSWRLVNGQYALTDTPFTEDWAPSRRREKAAEDEPCALQMECPL